MGIFVRRNWLVPASLIVLSVVPVVAGIYRIFTLLGDGSVNQDMERYFPFRISITVHVLSTTIFSMLGALQFSSDLRRGHWHAKAGKLVWASGCVAAVSGIWLTFVFPPGQHDGSALFAIRLIVATTTLFSLIAGLFAALQQNFEKHAAWMIRGYALGMGAGTQVFTHIPLILFPEMASELARTLCMSAGWGINLLVAERIIRLKNISRRGVEVGATV